MKRKDGFIVRQIAGQNVAVAVGARSKDFHGMIKLNDTALFIWNLLEKDTNVDNMVEAVLAEYDVDKDRARASVEKITGALRDAGILEE